jgi:hypothetical protein
MIKERCEVRSSMRFFLLSIMLKNPIFILLLLKMLRQQCELVILFYHYHSLRAEMTLSIGQYNKVIMK